MPNIKRTPITDEISTYVDEHRSDHGDTLLNELREETRKVLGGMAGMQIPAEQGGFFSAIVGAMGASLAVEVGTFTGYSAICIARALAPGGHLHCFDVSEEYTSIARRYWERDGLGDRITLHLGPATELIDGLPDAPIDFVFIDADKVSYDAYYELLLPRVRPGGLIAFDNVLWAGNIVNAATDDSDTLALRALNDKLVADTRVEATLLTIGDGIMLARKL
jgi:caffeoyl-CoA O-methyltransferase